MTKQKQGKDEQKELRKEELENKIESLNKSNEFFRNLRFNAKNIEPYLKQACFCRSEQDAKLEFWVDSFEDGESPRYCFGFEIPSKISNSDIADILPEVWWINDGDLGSTHYEKIIFEYGREKNIEKFENFENGNVCSENDVENLKSIPVLSKDIRYIVYYLKRGNEKESVEKFEKEFATFLNFMKQIMFKDFKELLLSNHNIILHGAPGTGKTYLAKEIAEAMGCSDDEIGFVQFHQSYDYTDFVEGLRPKEDENGNIGFEPKDGIFKKFCAKALKNLVDSKKTLEERKRDCDFEAKYNKFIDSIENGEISEVELKTNKKMDIVKVSEQNTIVLKTKNSSSNRVYRVSFNRLAQLAKIYSDKNSLKGLSNNDIRNAIKGCHASSYWAVLKALHGLKQDDVQKSPEQIQEKKYVFIIDEINRGEMSKIFGELFYSIDPGYRVKYKDLINHKENKERLTTIQTQYANLQKDANDFDNELGITDDDKDNHGHFFVPENVYIIGTMNDIDRSVESMDFAMRRRFAFKEITAKDRIEMLSALKSEDEAVKRMNSLNKVTEEIPGLSAAYHIGPAYFLKLKKYEEYTDAFDKLWEYHIEGVLKEYLRGMDSANEKLEKLAKAFGYSKV